jgi:hypothetical protein
MNTSSNAASSDLGTESSSPRTPPGGSCAAPTSTGRAFNLNLT